MFIVMKPVHWNPNDYLAPAGHPASKGSYPGQHGFGHEEWNNAPWGEIQWKGASYRAFHTEPVNSADDHVGDTLVLMYASHGGRQYLVGAAGRCSNLSLQQSDRRAIRRQLDLPARREEAWSLDVVKRSFPEGKRSFNEHWAKQVDFIPLWICPATHFFWCPNPVLISARDLVGKNKFQTRFSSYKQIQEEIVASQILRCVPSRERSLAWHAIFDDLAVEGREDVDVEAIESQPNLTRTDRQQLIAARLGQGRFRTEVLARWQGACAVTGSAVPQVLRASHIKPWRTATNEERLNPRNGIPLAATLDALFDRYLISFDTDGRMLFAPSLGRKERTLLGMRNGGLSRELDVEERRFMEAHRKEFQDLNGV